MTSDPSNYHREYSPYGSYSLFQFEGSDVISVLKNSIEYSFVFFKCVLNKNICIFVINEIMETTQPGKHIPPTELIAYPHDRIMPRYNGRVLLTENKENKGCIHQVIY